MVYTVKTNVVLHAPIVGLDLTKLKTAMDLVIKKNIGSLSNQYYFESNVVIEIPTSCQPVRVFPPDSKDATTQCPKNEVALYTLVDISYDWCSGMVISDDDKHIFYETAPGAIRQAVQASIKDMLCSGIRVEIGSIKFAMDWYCKNTTEPAVLVPFNDLDNRIRFHMEKHLDTLVPLLRSKL